MTSPDRTPIRTKHKGEDLIVYWDPQATKSQAMPPLPPRGAWKVSWGGRDVTGDVKRSGIVERDDLMKRALEVL